MRLFYWWLVWKRLRTFSVCDRYRFWTINVLAQGCHRNCCVWWDNRKLNFSVKLAVFYWGQVFSHAEQLLYTNRCAIDIYKTYTFKFSVKSEARFFIGVYIEMGNIFPNVAYMLRRRFFFDLQKPMKYRNWDQLIDEWLVWYLICVN